jgi:hypothetical protein
VDGPGVDVGDLIEARHLGPLLAHHHRPTSQVPQPLVATVGGRSDDSHHVGANQVAEHRLAVNRPQKIAQDRLSGCDRPAVDLQDAQAHGSFAGSLTVPEGLEQPGVEPHENENDERRGGVEHKFIPGDKREQESDQHASCDHQNDDQHVDQIGRDTLERACHPVLELDVLGCHHLDVRVELWGRGVQSRV